MIYEQLEVEVKRRIGNISPAMASKVPVLLDLAVKRIQQEGNFTFLENSYDFTTVANSNAGITLPSDYRDFYGLRCLTAAYEKRLEPVDLEELESKVVDIYDTGIAKYFYVWGGKLFTYAVDDAARSYRLRYYMRLPTFIQGALPGTPGEFDEAIILYAVYTASLDIEDNSFTQGILADFERSIRRMRRLYLVKPLQMSRIRYG